MDIIVTHKNTDFDALASVVAATVLYPGAVAILPKTLNPNVKAFLSIHKDVFSHFNVGEIDLAAVKKLIVVDVNRWDRLEGLTPLQQRKDIDIHLWDHHRNGGTISASTTCVEQVGAAVSLMVRQLQRLGKPISRIQATLMLTGLYEDTGNLTFPATTAADAYAAGFLLEQKADLDLLATFINPVYGEKQKDMLFQMIQSARRTRVRGYKISFNRQEIRGHVDSLAVVVRMYREIVNVDAAFGIFNDPGNKRCLVIGRSKVDGLDMGQIMHALGGGGHPGAGSAVVREMSADEIEKKLRDYIEGHRKNMVQISDLMSFPVTTVEATATMEEVAHMLRQKGCTGLPVVENGKLVGVISRRDFKRVKNEAKLKAPVKAFMSTKVVTIPPGKSPMDAARLMVKHDVGRLPVIEDGRIIGIVTRTDTMAYFYDLPPA